MNVFGCFDYEIDLVNVVNVLVNVKWNLYIWVLFCVILCINFKREEVSIFERFFVKMSFSVCLIEYVKYFVFNEDIYFW